MYVTVESRCATDFLLVIRDLSFFGPDTLVFDNDGLAPDVGTDELVLDPLVLVFLLLLPEQPSIAMANTTANTTESAAVAGMLTPKVRRITLPTLTLVLELNDFSCAMFVSPPLLVQHLDEMHSHGQSIGD